MDIKYTNFDYFGCSDSKKSTLGYNKFEIMRVALYWLLEAPHLQECTTLHYVNNNIVANS